MARGLQKAYVLHSIVTGVGGRRLSSLWHYFPTPVCVNKVMWLVPVTVRGSVCCIGEHPLRISSTICFLSSNWIQNLQALESSRESSRQPNFWISTCERPIYPFWRLSVWQEIWIVQNLWKQMVDAFQHWSYLYARVKIKMTRFTLNTNYFKRKTKVLWDTWWHQVAWVPNKELCISYSISEFYILRVMNWGL